MFFDLELKMVANRSWHFGFKDRGNFVCAELDRSRPDCPRH